MLIREIKEIIVLHTRMVLYHCFLCTYRIKQAIYNFHCDRKLGIETRGYYCEEKEQTLCRDAKPYQAVQYTDIEKILNYLKLNENDVLIDFGCGKGRVLILASLRKIKKVIGVEYSKFLVDIANKNTALLNIPHSPIEIFHNDAADFEIKEENIFFINQAFGVQSLSRVLDNIKQSLLRNPRPIRIVYNSRECRVLLDISAWLERETVVEGTEYYVWRSIST